MNLGAGSIRGRVVWFFVVIEVLVLFEKIRADYIRENSVCIHNQENMQGEVQHVSIYLLKGYIMFCVFFNEEIIFNTMISVNVY